MTASRAPSRSLPAASICCDRAQGQPAHLRYLCLLPSSCWLASPHRRLGIRPETARGGATRRGARARLSRTSRAATGATPAACPATPGSPRSTPSSDTWNIDLHPVLTNLARSHAIPMKKTDEALVAYLTRNELQALLDAPDPRVPYPVQEIARCCTWPSPLGSGSPSWLHFVSTNFDLQSASSIPCP